VENWRDLAMSEPEKRDLTELLQKWNGGDQEALEELTPLVHAELRRIAKRYMARERNGHTLQATALVNEAFIRLIDWKNARWENRAHFFGVAANLMRRISWWILRANVPSGTENRF
jgi:RNA polymerase sigma factor (TIGR02999 family)